MKVVVLSNYQILLLIANLSIMIDLPKSIEVNAMISREMYSHFVSFNRYMNSCNSYGNKF